MRFQRNKIFNITCAFILYLFSCTTAGNNRINIISLQSEKLFPFDEQITAELAINYLKQLDYQEKKNGYYLNNYDLLNPLIDHQIYINNVNETKEIVYVIFLKKMDKKRSLIYIFQFEGNREYLSMQGILSYFQGTIEEKSYRDHIGSFVDKHDDIGFD